MTKLHSCKLLWLFLIFAALTVSNLPAAELVDTNVCVYGGTSGGVTAAIEAARLGKSVVLISQNNHLGGMTSGGLGWTDYGNKGAIGGLSREFYRRMGQHYGQAESFTFEPHVAEQSFSNWLYDAGVPVYFGHRLASVTMNDQRLSEIITENGDVFRARMFIDTTYEGDLMAAAGVSFTFGREGTNTYGESLNGIRASTPQHQFAVNVDPYVVPGDSNSGLLPYIAAGDGGTPGDGDQRLQTYNYRLCLTQVATNRMPLTAPPGYQASNYELLGRYFQARVAAGQNLTLRNFLKIDSLPNGKTDINNNGAFSTDFIGMNYTYATNTWAARDQMCRDHENYTRGLLYFLATDPRVPANVRNEMNSWGLCRDEFQDTGNWPHQLYVREARRMVSDYVMLQQNCQGLRFANDSVGLASYTMDSHNCQRVVQNGYVRNEGDVQVGVPAPYPISYRSMVPRVGECENLFVTFALSASHMGFGSCRMEPVFMITSQSAAAGAALAIDRDVAVQNVPYSLLEAQLLAEGQLLRWGSSTIDPANGIVVDSEDTNGVVLIGGWSPSMSVAGFHGANYLHDGNTNQGLSNVRLTPNLPQAGPYDVYLRWTMHANRATNVPVTLKYDGGVKTFSIDQTVNGSTWFPLGRFDFEAGTNGDLLIETTDTKITGTSGYVIADAALWLPADSGLAEVQMFAVDGVAAEDGPDPATFTFFRSGDTAADLTVDYAISGSATPGADFTGATGTLTIPAGQTAVNLTITPLLDTEIEGDETVSLTLLTNAAYSVGPLAAARAVIHDEAFDAWRLAHFNAAQLADPTVSGANADPDQDRITNLWECSCGSDPWQSNSTTCLVLQPNGAGFSLELTRVQTAAALQLTLETSTNLIDWALPSPALPAPTITRNAPHETLHYPLGSVTENSQSRFWRMRLALPSPDSSSQ